MVTGLLVQLNSLGVTGRSSMKSTFCKNFALLSLTFLALVVFPRCLIAASPRQAGTNSAQNGGAESPTDKHIVYKNKRYRFRAVLPASWKGYSILISTWSGAVMDEHGQFTSKTETGPLITIRHPLWSETEPRQDIPIMVFTSAQWRIVDSMILSAAPVGPGEIGRNKKYVFALPCLDSRRCRVRL